MRSFKDAQIALLEARMSGELANLVRRYGGTPYCVPAVREAPLDCARQVSTFIDRLVDSSLGTVIFLTGVGVQQLLRETQRLERLDELLVALQKVTVVCRGPKPSAILKRNGITTYISAHEPYTTTELLEVLAPLELAGTVVGVVHYGERNAPLAQALLHRGADLEELCLYEWLLPEDMGPLQILVQNIIAQRVDAVVFTSQIQARHLFLVAKQLKLADELADALNKRTIVASIGPTCTGALQSFRVTPHVIPEHPKMGHLMKALADYMVSER